MSGYLIAFLAIICYASTGVLAKNAQLTIPPLSFITGSMLFLTCFAFIASIIHDKEFQFSNLPMSWWFYLAFFGFVNFVGFTLYLYALTKMPVAEYQIFFVITPVIGGLLAYFFLNETLKPQYIIGLIFIGFGLYIALKK